MKKKKQHLILLALSFLTVAVVFYFLIKRNNLKPDFIYTRFPSIAGVSTTLLNNARSVIPPDLPTLTNLFSSSSADTSNSNLLRQLSEEASKKVDYLKNSLIEAGLEKIGYTPIMKQSTVEKITTSSPCISPPKDY